MVKSNYKPRIIKLDNNRLNSESAFEEILEIESKHPFIVGSRYKTFPPPSEHKYFPKD